MSYDPTLVCDNCKARGHAKADCTIDPNGWDESGMIESMAKDEKIAWLERRVRLLSEGRQKLWARAEGAIEDRRMADKECDTLRRERDEAREWAELMRDNWHNGVFYTGTTKPNLPWSPVTVTATQSDGTRNHTFDATPCPNAECTLPKGHDGLCNDLYKSWKQDESAVTRAEFDALVVRVKKLIDYADRIENVTLTEDKRLDRQHWQLSADVDALRDLALALADRVIGDDGTTKLEVYTLAMKVRGDK